MNLTVLRRLILFTACLGLLAWARAQAPASSPAITGRVLNAANGEYLRNAEVRIQGTSLVAISEDGGYYRINNAPPGEVTVVATYLGHAPTTTRVTVSATGPTNLDLELKPAAGSAVGETIQLGAFVVSSELDGQAKALSEQKQAMNVKTVVASDNFGDIAEGNIGEFLKFMPGIQIDSVETDTRAARMGPRGCRYVIGEK